MSITSRRTVQVEYSGDMESNLIISALDNEIAMGDSFLTDLASGNTVIGIPSSSGLIITAVTIIPPSNNTIPLRLKGTPTDDGIQLHPTDPTSIALHPSQGSFVLDVGDAMNGLRLVYS